MNQDNDDLKNQINNWKKLIEDLEIENKSLQNNLDEVRDKNKEEYSEDIINKNIEGLHRNIENLEEQRNDLEKRLNEVLKNAYQYKYELEDFKEKHNEYLEDYGDNEHEVYIPIQKSDFFRNEFIKMGDIGIIVHGS